jgi:hypothetical protein
MAFDGVHRTKMWNILLKRRVDKKLLMAIKSLYDNSTNFVIRNNMRPGAFAIKQGLRQGGVMSPVLFNVYMDEIMKECRTHTNKLNVGYKNMMQVGISECAFADDMVILSGSELGLQRNVNIWNDMLKKYDMKINVQKSKVMMTATEEEELKTEIEGEKMDQVKEFKYLGVVIQSDAKQEKYINQWIEKGSRGVPRHEQKFYKKEGNIEENKNGSV